MLSSAGIGLRSQHLDELIGISVRPAFLEVHAENYLRPSPSLEKVLRLRHDFEFSVHAVGLSLGSADGIDEAHLDQVARLVGRLQPTLVSEHLSWSRFEGRYFNDYCRCPTRRSRWTSSPAMSVACRIAWDDRSPSRTRRHISASATPP